jgi:hypothetical protein
MLGMRLVRLIETHSGKLSKGLTEHIQKSERTSDFKKIPAEELEHAASELYHNLGEWLLQKTEKDIEARFRAVAALRAAEGVRLHQLVWALLLSREYLWRFLRQEALADNVVAVYGELEVHQLLRQFFDRAIYYTVWGYEEARPAKSKGDLERARDLAVSIGLMSARERTSQEMEEHSRNM